MNIARVGFITLLVGSACTRGPEPIQATASGSDTEASTIDSDGSVATSSDASGTASSASASTTAGTTGGPDPFEACASITTQEGCENLYPEPTGEYRCVWGELVTVEVEAGECNLGTPMIGCHAMSGGGSSKDCGLSLLGPGECLALEPTLYQAYREIDGVTYLWRELPWGCAAPLLPAGETWEWCPAEEFYDVPDLCYCRCGGPPDGGTGTGTGTSGP